GLGEYTFVGVGSDQVIEVVGESSEEGESVDLYQPNSNSNQPWKLMNTNIDAAEMASLVEQFEQENDFERDEDAHDLKMHLIAIRQFEREEKSDKVVKHLKSLKKLLEHQKEEKLMSESGYETLYDQTEYLIQEWQ